MTDTITAGTILVAGGTHLLKSLLLQNESDSNGWAAIKDARATFEKTVQEAGWTFFFMAGEIKTTIFGFDKQKALRTAADAERWAEGMDFVDWEDRLVKYWCCV